MFVPIKNVAVIPYPAVSDNDVTTVAISYVGMNSPNDLLPSFTVHEIVGIFNRMLDLTLGNDVHLKSCVPREVCTWTSCSSL